MGRIEANIALESMGGTTVGQWGQLAPTEMRLWGQNCVIMLLPPLKSEI